MSAASTTAADAPSRPTRFVVLRDRDGVRVAVARAAIAVLRETDEGDTLLLLSGGRVVAMADGLDAVLDQLA